MKSPPCLKRRDTRNSLPFKGPLSGPRLPFLWQVLEGRGGRKLVCSQEAPAARSSPSQEEPFSVRALAPVLPSVYTRAPTLERERKDLGSTP